MTATPAEATKNGGAWDGFKGGLWRDTIDVRDFIQRNYTPVRGRRDFLAGPTQRTSRALADAGRDVPGGARKGIYDVDADTPSASSRTRPATSTRTTRSSSACRPTRRSSARSCPTAAGGWSRTRSKPTATSPTRRSRKSSPSTARPTTTGVFDAYTAGHPRRPQLAHHHRPAGRLRPRPHHRRLPPGRAVRRGPAHRRQAGRTGRAGRAALATEDVIRDREELAEQIRALQELKADGRRATASTSPGPAADRPGSRAVAVLRLPRRGEGAERRGDVARPHRRPSSTSTSSATSRPACSPRSRRRRSSTTSSSSCASCASCARPNTTSCSPATRPGSPSRSAAWARTAARWSPRPASACCRPCTTWARRPSRT